MDDMTYGDMFGIFREKQQSSNSHLAFRSNHCPRGKLRIQIEVCLEEWHVVYTAYIYLSSAVNTKEIFKFPNIFPLDCPYLAKSVDFKKNDIINANNGAPKKIINKYCLSDFLISTFRLK